MKRIILHWTAGGWVPNSSDLRAYHFVIDREGKVHTGVPVANNKAPLKSGYAAHTLNCNTDSIGVSLACMAGAVESPFNSGKYPMTRVQFDSMIDFVRDLADQYSIPVSPQTVLSHAEVQGNLGITQRGKWDYTRLPFDPGIRGARAIGDHIRSLIKDHKELDLVPDIPVPAGATGVVSVGLLNTRRSPNGEVRGEIPRGTPLEIIGRSGDWLEAYTPDGKARGYTVWVYRPMVTITDGPPVEEPTQPNPKRLQAAQLRAIADQLEAEADAGL